MLEVSEAEAAALKEQAPLAGAEGLTRIMEVLAEAEMRLRDAASKKILVEVALLKAIEARSAVSIDAVLKQLQTLREGKAGEARQHPRARGEPVRSPRARPPPPRRQRRRRSPRCRRPPPCPRQPGERAPRPRRRKTWRTCGRRLLEAVGRASPFTRTYLLEAHPVSFQKNVFTIGFDPEFEDHIGLVDNARNHTLLQTKLPELGHPNAQIKFIKAAAPEAPGCTGRTGSTAAARLPQRRAPPKPVRRGQSRRLHDRPPRRSSPPCLSARTISRTTR